MKKRSLLIIISIFNCCIACSTDDPLLAELEEKVVADYTGEKAEIENSDSYLSEVILADPYILRDDAYYYAYGTYDANNGFAAYKSQDLYTWEYVGMVLEKKNTFATGTFWAPEVYKIDNTYYMYYAADKNLYVAKSDSPEGPFVQIGAVSIFKKGIDPHLYIEGDKKYLFFANTSGKYSVWMGELNDDLISLKEGTVHECLYPQGWERGTNEGPFIYKHGDMYYLTYSGDGYQYQNYGVAVATSSDIMGSWEKASYNPVLQKREPWVGTGHHSLFVDKDGINRIVFHAHNDKSSVNPRRMYIGKFHIDKNGVFIVDNSFIVPKLKDDPASARSLHTSTTKAQPIYNAGGIRRTESQGGISITKGKKNIVQDN